MDVRRRAALLAGLVALLFGAAGGTTGRSQAGDLRADSAVKTTRLVAFPNCSAMLAHVKARAEHFVGPFGFGPVATPTATRESTPKKGVDYSGTNVQEAGVDEPDLVKTDGETLFAVANGRLNAIDVGEGRPRLLDTLKLDNGWSHELLLHGQRLLVLSRGGFWAEPLPAATARIAPYVPSKSVLYEIDVANPKALRVVRTLTLDGAYVAARLVGGVARIVVASQVPTKLPFATPDTGTPEARAAARERNQDVVAASGLASWLPHYTIKRQGRPAGKQRPLVQCRRVQRPATFSGLGMLTVLTVDLAKGLEPVDSTAVMTDARIVFASPESLYVATERWDERLDPDTPKVAQSGATTALHRFDISSPSKTRYRGSGQVSGYLLSQWSLSEYRGVLRVVSTETPAWWGPGNESESFLTTLRVKDDALTQLGRVGELGKGERVYAVRFVGDVGYVVTFRQIDPLYTVDLSDADRPRVLGELKIAGYSAYLHPIGDDLLLGVGQNADPQGRRLGAQLSIFDVSNLRRPTLLHHAALGPGWSEAESDHHAFLFWPRTGLVVIPIDVRAVGFRVGRTRGIDEVARIEHTRNAAIHRSLVVGDAVLTVSDAGVKASSLATLADRGWAAFPPAEPATPKR
jgi:uncharacterized secreted protein with C-terminal beta-propeller domain